MWGERSNICIHFNKCLINIIMVVLRLEKSIFEQSLDPTFFVDEDDEKQMIEKLKI